MLLYASFLPHEVDMILGIPIHHNAEMNNLIWHWDNRVIFLVRSAYYVGLEIKKESSDRGSSSDLGGKFQWKKLWDIPLPSKIKLFGWSIL